ncbi:ATP-binding cassette domain-containing protein [Metamycoplasma alkalescens]|uniref:Phosphonates import ATP-binding protein phnC n=3 Tax=Metamycoplasma alkalescens TaxID=45363 RepID=N9UAJ7_9BACT|nr:ATP-binding cassette domain-containing protein [Metamycoplasma alkalescens]ENY53948.1 Phosphonates import ATP-binding protein phnC [Metamycoplasma alkalescens 14918]PYF43667.1 phosphonate transport system ATP-binding protein [Metamycoplasma alkalescens]
MQSIKFKNYFASYQKEKNNVLKNITLEINRGEMIAIIGKSGSGKTTLFNALLKQLKTRSGNLFINDKNIDLIKKKEWKKIINKVGYLSQETNLINHLNVYENILHFYLNYKNKFCAFFKILTKKQKQEIYDVLSSLDILDKIYTKISDLSGGQKQRVAIAKLLLKNVDIILADEPTSSLDIKTSKDIMNILKKINKEYQTTILINIHDLNIVQTFFDQYCFIKNGELIQVGNPKNLSQKEIEKLYEV